MKTRYLPLALPPVLSACVEYTEVKTPPQSVSSTQNRAQAAVRGYSETTGRSSKLRRLPETAIADPANMASRHYPAQITIRFRQKPRRCRPLCRAAAIRRYHPCINSTCCH